jgi:two-component system invasion response regulator UvrY
LVTPGSLRILLVEDHTAVGQATRTMLERLGHSPAWVTTLGEAVAAAEREAFDLLISDFTLPDGTAIEALAKVRSLCPAIKSIVITIRNTYLAPVVLGAGFGRFLEKPVRSADLMNAIAGLWQE